jgi:hypothetical protein
VFPDADQLADVFQLGTAVGPVERMGTGWGGHNVLWRLTTTSGHWAIKQVRRDPGRDVIAAMAIELAASRRYAYGSCACACDSSRLCRADNPRARMLRTGGRIETLVRPGSAAQVGLIPRLGWFLVRGA